MASSLYKGRGKIGHLQQSLFFYSFLFSSLKELGVNRDDSTFLYNAQ